MLLISDWLHVAVNNAVDCVMMTASSMVIAVDDMDNVLEPLPKQLEAVKPATEFPAERHRWNTNEVTV